MKKISYYISFIIVLGVLLVSFWGYRKYFQKNQVDYLFFEVKQGTLEEVVKVRGKVVAQKEFDMEFPFLGTVKEVLVKEGEMVDKGAPLMTMETTNFELELDRLRAQSAQVTANVRSAHALLDETKAATSVTRSKVSQYESSLEAQKALLAELNRGTRDEVIQIAKTAVNNAKRDLEDVTLSLKNTQKEAEQYYTSIVQASYDTVHLASITTEKILSQYLQDIIYPIRYPENKTCTFQLKSFVSQDEGNVEQDCLDALKASEAIASFDSSSYENLEDTLLIDDIQGIKNNLLVIRNLLSGVLDVVNATISNSSLEVTETELLTLKTSVTSAQSELETIIGKITEQLESLKTQLLTNKSSIDTAQKVVNQAENALASAQAELELQQAKTLPERISSQEAKVRQIEAQLESQRYLIQQSESQEITQEANVKQAESKRAVINAQMDLIREKIKKSTITAPMATKILKIWLEEGEFFTPGEIALSLSSSANEIQADISELDIVGIRDATSTDGEGNDVSILFDAFPNQEFAGKVISIEPREIIKDGDRYYRVHISLEDQSESIRSGMSVDLFISIATKKNILKIPEYTLYSREGKTYVSLYREGKVEEVEIKTGISDGEFIEVTKGLHEGQNIVVSND